MRKPERKAQVWRLRYTAERGFLSWAKPDAREACRRRLWSPPPVRLETLSCKNWKRRAPFTLDNSMLTPCSGVQTTEPYPLITIAAVFQIRTPSDWRTAGCQVLFPLSKERIQNDERLPRANRFVEKTGNPGRINFPCGWSYREETNPIHAATWQEPRPTPCYYVYLYYCN